ncbi:uncharacterized protein LOC112006433 [Quercus suber]|uniref:uncharacterized protein LOC112006433 n=1 Tax=Quercus suber TaxID=58331 RepID=UPI0032DEDF82
MASNAALPNLGMEQRPGDAENSLEKIKRQLASGSGRNLLQGPLLKRSETLRKWNERWVILDPTTGRMEYKLYKVRVGDRVKFWIDRWCGDLSLQLAFPVLYNFAANREASVESSLISQGTRDGRTWDVCFNRGSNDWEAAVVVDFFRFLAANLPSGTVGVLVFLPELSNTYIAFYFSTYVSFSHCLLTFSATQLVLKAHKEAVNSLSGNGSAKLGTVAAVVAAANSTALECSKEIESAMQISLRNALGMVTNRTTDGPMDDVAIMRETLRVKDEELHNLAQDLRARDSTIREIAEKLSETAEAAESAASAAHTMDEQRRIACAEIERVKRDSEKQLESCVAKLKEYEQKVMTLSREKDQLIKQRDSANQEAHMWRSELAKARERVVILEAAVVRAEEKVRVTEADAESRIKEAVQKESAAVKEKQELLAYVNKLQTQLQRHHIDTKQVFEEKTESCSSIDNTLPLTKHVDLSEENVDKACLSVSRAVPVPGESVVHVAADQVNLRPIGDGEWSDIQATEARIADVREVAPEIEGSSLDIPVVSQPVNNHHEQGANSFHQP